MPPVAGVAVGGIAAGLKTQAGVKDLFVATLSAGATIAGVFTRSRCPSAPVDWCRRILGHGKVRAIVVNSGNANAFTGTAGDRTVAETAKAAASLFDCSEEEVYQASTGVIGVPVPADHIGRTLPNAAAAVSQSGWRDAAEAIRTTDTFAKAGTRTALIDGVPVTLSGIAKGSGMIAPDMATMLAFVFTDARLPAPVLQACLNRANATSFNAITVDSDTSTSDTLLLAASGQAEHGAVTSAQDRRLRSFRAALDDLCQDLAKQIVRDGEGAQKLIEITVSGAKSAVSARRVGLAIANSPLVKTAIAGEDANWGRIVMAVGKAGEPADRDQLSIAVGGVPITRKGQPVQGYDEAPVAAHMKGREVAIAVDLGIGRGRSTVWTCDLTHGYISINADYRS